LGDVWIASGDTASTVFELGSGGTPISPPSTGYTASNCPCNGIAADSSGDMWLLGGGSSSAGLAGISSAGAQGSIVFPPGFNNNTYFNSIAADGSGNLWIADKHNHGVWEYTVSSTTWAGASGGGPFPNIAALNNPSTPGRIAIDGAGHKWIANQSTLTSGPPASSLTELTADGATNLSPIDGFGSGTISGAYTVAIDVSGNVWVTAGGTSVVEFIGAAAPTRNPIASGVQNGFAP
jgi:ligand-binding sensor domain-containing protein